MLFHTIDDVNDLISHYFEPQCDLNICEKYSFTGESIITIF